LPEECRGVVNIGYLHFARQSYLALDLAVAMAIGRPFLGKQVLQGGVLYIATEGQITIRRRLMAARQGVPLDEKLIAVIQEPPSDFMKTEDVDRIIATAKHINEEMLKATGFPLRMIILDTMISGFGIGDWNNVADTSDAMKVLRRIKDEVGVAVTAVHHHGKDASRGAAGSYALAA
jgi:RecA-family ATPase